MMRKLPSQTPGTWPPPALITKREGMNRKEKYDVRTVFLKARTKIKTKVNELEEEKN